MSVESYNPAIDLAEPDAFDLMKVRGVGRLLRWRHARTLLQIPLLIVSVVMILHGLLGRPLDA